jgi:methionyl-tRNA formyltransferase
MFRPFRELLIIISKDDTAISLYERSVEAAVENFKEFIEGLNRSIDIPKKPIQGVGMFYRKNDILSLKKIECLEDFQEVDRKSRAFYFPPHEPAYFEINGIRFYVSRKPY